MTGLLIILNVDEKIRNSILRDESKVYTYVREESKKQYDIEWLQPLGFNNTYALMMRENQTRKLNIKTISNLKNFIVKRNTW